jgi:hypothetical protein
VTTPKKDQRWAILPPREPSAEDATGTHQRVREREDDPEHQSGEHQSQATEPTERDAVSRRRARTEPEFPALDQLVSEVAQAISTPRPPAFEQLGSAQLDSAVREAATAPPDAPSTLASPAQASAAEGASLAPVPTLIDMILPGHGEGQGATILERSRVVGPSGVVPAGDGGETLPSPPWLDDES